MVWHTDNVEKYEGSLEELALDVFKLNNFKFACFLGYLSTDLHEQAGADYGRKRFNLSDKLFNASKHLEVAKNYVDCFSLENSRKNNHVEKYKGSLNDLAKDIGFMTYDKTSLFLNNLGNKVLEYSESENKLDCKENKSEYLFRCAKSIQDCKDEIDLAWQICIPYMKK